MEPYLNKIIQGDCLEIMKQFPDKSIDVCITDPPYGVKMDKGFEGFEGFGGFGKPIARRRYEEDDWDAERPDKEYFEEILRVSKKVFIFGGNFFADILPQSTHWIVWDKLNTMPSFGDCELIWTNVDRKSVKKITHEYNGLIGREDWRAHPTQKPLELVKKIIATYTEPNDVIFDPFAGSGTTAVAGKQTGRKYIAVELNEKYCKVAQQRLAQEVLFV